MNHGTIITALLVPYPAMLDVLHELVEHVAWLLYEHRRARNTRWRKLGCFDQAQLAPVHLRKNEPLPALEAGFGVSAATSTATAWRYVDEILDVLAAWAPGLHEALTGLGEDDFVIVEGRPDPHRPHRRGRTVLPAKAPQAPQARHERAGRRPVPTAHRCGFPRDIRPHPRPDRGPRPQPSSRPA